MIRHRRNNALAGIVLLIAAILIASSAFLPWAHFEGPTIDLRAVTASVSYDMTPGVNAPDNDVTRPAILIFGAVVGALALALVATRVRGLGVLWRLIALVVIAGPIIASWFVWTNVIADPAGYIGQDTSISGQLGAVGFNLAQALGLIRVAAGTGLWAMSIGAGLGFVAIWIPAVRSQTLVLLPGQPYPGAGFANGYYPPQPDAGPYSPSYPPPGG